MLFQSRRGPESTFRRALVRFRFRHRQSDRQRLDERLGKYRRIRAAFAEDATEMSVAFGDGDDKIMVRLADALEGKSALVKIHNSHLSSGNFKFRHLKF